MADRKVYLNATVQIIAVVDEGETDMAAVAAYALRDNASDKPEDFGLELGDVQIEDIQVGEVEVTDSK
jgi:hypothetical protein